MFDAGAVSAGCGAEDAEEPRYALAVHCAPRRCKRIVVVILIAGGDSLYRGVKECDLRWKEIAKQPGDTPGNIDARASDRGGRQHFDPGDAARGMVPDRPAAHERQSLRDLLAAGAQCRASPEVDDHRPRHLAVRLQMRAHHFVGGEPAKLHRGWCRQRARIGGEKIASGRQHIAPSARRRSSGARCDTASVECREESCTLGFAAAEPCRVNDARRRPAENVLAVLDGKVLEIAQPGVDTPQGFVGRDRAAAASRNAGFFRQSGALRSLDDQRREPLTTAAVEAFGLRVFVEQKFEFVRLSRRAAGNERWRQMPDGHASKAALGLRRLARITDDEGIEHRQRCR